MTALGGELALAHQRRNSRTKEAELDGLDVAKQVLAAAPCQAVLLLKAGVTWMPPSPVHAARCRQRQPIHALLTAGV